MKSTAKDVIVIIEYPHRCFASDEFYILFLSWKHTEWSQLGSSRVRRYELATRRSADLANKLRDEVLGQGTATSFGKAADWEDGGLMFQRTLLPELEFRLLLY